MLFGQIGPTNERAIAFGKIKAVGLSVPRGDAFHTPNMSCDVGPGIPGKGTALKQSRGMHVELSLPGRLAFSNRAAVSSFRFLVGSPRELLPLSRRKSLSAARRRARQQARDSRWVRSGRTMASWQTPAFSPY